MSKITGLYCKSCHSRMFTGQQYYAFQKNYIDLTCIKCANSIDVELKKLNYILKNLGFKEIEERHDIQEAVSK